MIDTDCALVERARRGDLAAFNELVERYRRPLYALAYTRLGNADDAHDSTQEAFIDAYLGLDRLQQCGAFKAWITTILNRRCAGMLQARREHADLSEQSADRQLIWEDHSLADTAFGHAWLTLSQEDRRVLFLSAVAGYSYRDIAADLHISINAVRSRIHRARRRLYQEVYPMSDAATVHLTRETMERLLLKLTSVDEPFTAMALKQVAEASADQPVSTIAKGLAWIMDRGESFERAFLLTGSLPPGLCTLLLIGRESCHSETAFKAVIQMLKSDLLPPDAPISRERLAECFAYLSCILQTGIPLFQSMEMAGKRTPELTKAFQDIQDALRSRESMTTALERHPQIFSKGCIAALRFGECSYRFETVLAVLATYLWEPSIIDREKIHGVWSERLKRAEDIVQSQH